MERLKLPDFLYLTFCLPTPLRSWFNDEAQQYTPATGTGHCIARDEHRQAKAWTILPKKSLAQE